MRAALRSALFAAICGVIGASNAWAVPITWEASGVVDFVSDYDPFGALDGLEEGTPWRVELTFDPDAPGVLLHPGSSPTYWYEDAISNARFQLGAVEYINPGGDIFVNADLPVMGISTELGGPGLVQFQFLGGWLGGAGGPDLNLGIGLLLLSYNDLNAIDGSVPWVPNRAPNQSALSGLRWGLGYPYSQFLSSSFNPVPVPEPTSMLLVGTGLALVAARLRKRKRKPSA